MHLRNKFRPISCNGKANMHLNNPPPPPPPPPPPLTGVIKDGNLTTIHWMRVPVTYLHKIKHNIGSHSCSKVIHVINPRKNKWPRNNPGPCIASSSSHHTRPAFRIYTGNAGELRFQGRTWVETINTLRPKQNGRHFADDTFKRIFVNENGCISIEISLKFVSKGPINSMPELVQIMAWCRPGAKPLSEPMMVRLPTHKCATWLQWVNVCVSY